MAQLALAGVRVLYSSGQEETAALLASLVQGEASKGLSLPRALRLSPWQEELVTWLLLSPGLSLGAALTLATSFPSLREVVLAPSTLLQQRGGISQALAARLWLCIKFLDQEFFWPGIYIHEECHKVQEKPF